MFKTVRFAALATADGNALTGEIGSDFGPVALTGTRK